MRIGGHFCSLNLSVATRGPWKENPTRRRNKPGAQALSSRSHQEQMVQGSGPHPRPFHHPQERPSRLRNGLRPRGPEERGQSRRAPTLNPNLEKRRAALLHDPPRPGSCSPGAELWGPGKGWAPTDPVEGTVLPRGSERWVLPRQVFLLSPPPPPTRVCRAAQHLPLAVEEGSRWRPACQPGGPRPLRPNRAQGRAGSGSGLRPSRPRGPRPPALRRRAGPGGPRTQRPAADLSPLPAQRLPCLFKKKGWSP